MLKDFELIVTMVKKGYSDKVVEASREGGAKGGTIIYGRDTYSTQESSLMGINLQTEKEIVFTIVQSKQKAEIMKLIYKKTSLIPDSDGICFTLPINAIVGLKKTMKRLEEQVEKNIDNVNKENVKTNKKLTTSKNKKHN